MVSRPWVTLTQTHHSTWQVVDGLPSALVFGERAEGRGAGMPYATELMHRGVAVGYRLRARPPTVTLPRLKALTAGVIASFLDVFFNFAASELTHDSWLRQMHLRGWPMVRDPSHFFRQVGDRRVVTQVAWHGRLHQQS
jgi:predicted AlkP superfamily pyrophosphatase or phosphodiesterase